MADENKNKSNTSPGSSQDAGGSTKAKSSNQSQQTNSASASSFFYSDANREPDGRLHPLLDSFYTGVFGQDERAQRDYYFRTTGVKPDYSQFDEEFEEYYKKPKKTSRKPAQNYPTEPKPSKEQVAQQNQQEEAERQRNAPREKQPEEKSISTDLLDGAKEYGNHAVRALNKYTGTEIREWVAEGELGYWGDVVKNGEMPFYVLGAYAAGMGAVGFFAGGPIGAVAGVGTALGKGGAWWLLYEAGDTALQATRDGDDLVDTFSTGLDDLLVDGVRSIYDDGHINTEDEHYLFGKIDANTPYLQKLGTLGTQQLMLYGAMRIVGGTLKLAKGKNGKVKLEPPPIPEKALKNKKGPPPIPAHVRKDVDRETGIAVDALIERAESTRATKSLQNIEVNKEVQEYVYNLHRQKELAEAGLDIGRKEKSIKETVKNIKKGKKPPPTPDKAKGTKTGAKPTDASPSEISYLKIWEGSLQKLTGKLPKSATIRKEMLEDALVDGLEYTKKEGGVPKTVRQTGKTTKQKIGEAADKPVEGSMSGPKSESQERVIALMSTETKLYKAWGRALRNGMDAEEQALWNEIFGQLDIEKSGLIKEAGGTLGMSGNLSEASRIKLNARAGLMKKIRDINNDRLGRTSIPAKIVKGEEGAIFPKSKKLSPKEVENKILTELENYDNLIDDANAMGVGKGTIGKVGNELMRIKMDNWLNEGALTTSIFSNITVGTYEWIRLGMKNPRNIRRNVADTGGDLANAVQMAFSPEAWKAAWQKAISGGGNRWSNVEIPEEIGKARQIWNTARSSAYTFLTLSDDVFDRAVRSVKVKNAVAKYVSKSLDSGVSAKRVEQTLEAIKKGDEVESLGLKMVLRNEYDDITRRWTMRADRMADDTPYIARPVWGLHNKVTEWAQNSPSSVSFILQNISVFSRVGANSADYLARNSALRLIDYAFQRELHTRGLGRALMGTAAIVGPVEIMEMMGDEAFSLEGNPYAHDPDYSSERRKSAFRHKEGFHVGDFFVEWRRLGPMGEGMMMYSRARTAVTRALVSGDIPAANRAAGLVADVTMAMFQDQYLFRNLMPFLMVIARGSDDERVEALTDQAKSFIPLAGITKRFINTFKGQRPTGDYLTVMANATSDLASQVGPMGRRMNGVDNLTAYTEGSPSFFKGLTQNPITHFLDPLSTRPWDKQSDELSRFFLAMGAYTGNPYYYYKDEDSEWRALRASLVDGAAREKLRPLRGSAKVGAQGEVRLDDIDRNQARMLLSLDMAVIRDVADHWEDKFARRPREGDDGFLEGVRQDYRDGIIVQTFQAVRNRLENDVGMREDEDLTGLLHRIATAPRASLHKNIRGDIESEMQMLRQEAHSFPGGMSSVWAEQLARKNVMVRIFNYVEAEVYANNVYAPSALVGHDNLRKQLLPQ